MAFGPATLATVRWRRAAASYRKKNMAQLGFLLQNRAIFQQCLWLLLATPYRCYTVTTIKRRVSVMFSGRPALLVTTAVGTGDDPWWWFWYCLISYSRWLSSSSSLVFFCSLSLPWSGRPDLTVLAIRVTPLHILSRSDDLPVGGDLADDLKRWFSKMMLCS